MTIAGSARANGIVEVRLSFPPWVIIIGCSTKHIFQDKEKVIMRGCVRDTKGS